MNVLKKVALQGLKKNRTGTLVTIVGVILSAAMITAVATFAVSLQSYLINGAAAKYGNWHVAFSDADASFVGEQIRDDRVESAAVFENIGYAELPGGQNPDKPYLFLAGFERETFDTLPVNLLSGRLPENSGEVVVPAHVASNGGVEISLGDTITLKVGSRTDGNRILSQSDPYAYGEETLSLKEERSFTVVGICQRPSFEEFTAPGYTLITTADSIRSTAADAGKDGAGKGGGGEESAGKEGSGEESAGEGGGDEENVGGENIGEEADTPAGFSLFVTLKNPRQAHSYAADASEGGTEGRSHADDASKGGTEGRSYAFNDEVLRFMGLSDDKIFNTMLYSIGGILVALIVLGSVFLIYNSFAISLNDRTHQLGILLSVGATKRQLQNSVLFEGLCIGAVGIPLGILAGIPSIRFILSLVNENFKNVLYDTVPLTLVVSVPALVAAAAVSLVTILISAYIPARRAAGIPVLECIRQTNDIRVEAKSVRVSRRAERLCGVEGTLALKNFRRNRKRCRSVILSLTLSVVLFVTADSFGMNLKQAAEQSAADSDYDICFCTENMDEKEVFSLYDQLREADGVYESSYQSISSYSCAVDPEMISEECRENQELADAVDGAELSIDLQFIEDGIYEDFLRKMGWDSAEYEGTDGRVVVVAKGRDGEGDMTDLFADSSAKLFLSAKTAASPAAGKLELTAVFADTYPLDPLPKDPSEVTPYTLMGIVPYSAKERFDLSGVSSENGLIFRSENPSRSTAEMEEMLQSQGIFTGYTLYNVSEAFEQNRNILFVTRLFSYVFTAMISLIAVANVFNTISTNIKLRRREFAMLRSVGMSDRAFYRMMRFECVLYGLRTLLFGLPAAGILSWAVYRGFVLGGAEDIGFRFPWGSMGISVLGVFLVISATMLYAVHRVKEENIIDALRDDLM